MLAIRRFVRGSLTLADTGEQLFPLLCAINVPLTSNLPVLLTIEISPAVRPRPGRRFGWKIGALTRRGGARASAAGSQHTSPPRRGPCRRDVDRRTDLQALFTVPEGS